MAATKGPDDMSLDPQKSPEAHSKTEGSVAALRFASRCSSVAPGATRAIPSQRPVQGADAGQRFPFPAAPGSGVVGIPLRLRRFAQWATPDVYRRVVDRERIARHQRLIGVACCALSAFVTIYMIVELARAVF